MTVSDPRGAYRGQHLSVMSEKHVTVWGTWCQWVRNKDSTETGPWPRTYPGRWSPAGRSVGSSRRQWPSASAAVSRPVLRPLPRHPRTYTNRGRTPSLRRTDHDSPGFKAPGDSGSSARSVLWEKPRQIYTWTVPSRRWLRWRRWSSGHCGVAGAGGVNTDSGAERGGGQQETPLTLPVTTACS